MSKEQEALSDLVYMATFSETRKHMCRIYDANELLKQALKRNEPMKLNGLENDWGCPNCDATIEYGDYKFCPFCGQAIEIPK